MSHADFIIIRVVCRCDLHCTSPEFHINGLAISDDRHTSVNKWMASEFSVEVLRNEESVSRVTNGRARTNFVAGIVRVDSDGCITQHRLRTCCRNNDFLVCANIRNRLI